MPTNQRLRSSRAVAKGGQDAAFAFPSSHHLVITTPGHVLSYDKNGLKNIFISGSEGILAAKEAKDGCGALAVADNHNVLLHRIEDGMERSYRLKGTEGEIRQFHFSPDSKTLFFTTTLLNAVQSYSLAEARILEPGPTHSSMPTVMALSPGSNLLLTASESPPTIHLQNRALGTQPLLLQPSASDQPVVQACFHPDRPTVFLLAFKDGAVAAYNATDLLRSTAEKGGHPVVVGGEIAIFTSLHSVTNRLATGPRSYFDSTSLGISGPQSLGVTGAAFIPGYRSRAITCGADGKCQVVDFDKRSVIISWHVRAPATCLSVLPSKTGKKPLVAVGKVDAKVAIYDVSGNLLQESKVHGDVVERVIDVEWIKGPSPKVIGDSAKVKMVDETWIELYTVGGSLRSRKTRSSTDDSHPRQSEVTSMDGSGSPGPASEGSGTVFHRPTERPLTDEVPEVFGENYMDLFSPIKQRRSPPKQAPESPRRRATPRQRPRLSSSTFVYRVATSPVPSSSAAQSIAEDSDIHHIVPARHTSLIEPLPSSSPATSSANMTILASIKRLGGSGGGPNRPKQQPGNLALFAPYMPTARGTVKKKPMPNRRVSKGRKFSIMDLSPKKAKTPKAAENKKDAPTKANDEDIWLTAESEDNRQMSSALGKRRTGSSKPPRKLMWPAERAMKQEAEAEAVRRPSVQLKMSAPISRAATQLELEDSEDSRSEVDRVDFGVVKVTTDLEQHTSEAPSTVPSKATSASFNTLYDDESGEGTITPGHLPPGFAESYHGPVSVSHYLPRRGSLAFPGSQPNEHSVPQQEVARRQALGEISGNDRQRHGSEDTVQAVQAGHDEKTCACCSRMRGEMQTMREEIAELRRLIKGKGRVA